MTSQIHRRLGVLEAQSGIGQPESPETVWVVGFSDGPNDDNSVNRAGLLFRSGPDGNLLRGADESLEAFRERATTMARKHKMSPQNVAVVVLWRAIDEPAA